MSLYKCVDGDRIDLIVLKHYGELKHLNDVISANKVLFSKSLNLESGLELELPEFVVESSEVVEDKERVALW